MYYVYIVEFARSGKFCTGLTSNLYIRRRMHGKGRSKITRDLGKFKLKFVAIFPDKVVTTRFKKYLKSHSGRVFRNKCLI